VRRQFNLICSFTACETLSSLLQCPRVRQTLASLLIISHIPLQPPPAKSWETASVSSPSRCITPPQILIVRDRVSSPIYLCDVSWPEVRRPPLWLQFFLILEPEFAIVNPHLLRELVARKMWGNEIKQSIIAANGSVQHLQLPEDIKAMYVSPHVT
jgi:hypothetical protein